MDIVPLIDWIGETQTGALFGFVTGIVFGVAAQRSRFACAPRRSNSRGAGWGRRSRCGS